MVRQQEQEHLPLVVDAVEALRRKKGEEIGNVVAKRTFLRQVAQRGREVGVALDRARERVVALQQLRVVECFDRFEVGDFVFVYAFFDEFFVLMNVILFYIIL